MPSTAIFERRGRSEIGLENPGFRPLIPSSQLVTFQSLVRKCRIPRRAGIREEPESTVSERMGSPALSCVIRPLRGATVGYPSGQRGQTVNLLA